jgi:hypothetical protein
VHPRGHEAMLAGEFIAALQGPAYRDDMRKAVFFSVLVAAVVLIGPAAAHAQMAAVSPSTSLHDGQVVTVTESDFLNVTVSAGSFNPAAFECRGGVFPPSASALIDDALVAYLTGLLRDNCVGVGSFVSGVNSLNVTVHRSFVAGSNIAVDCDAAVGCAIVVGGVMPGGLLGIASHAITFAPPTPPNTDSCKSGGWRHFADALGRPFRNQGACVSFVLRHQR